MKNTLHRLTKVQRKLKNAAAQTRRATTENMRIDESKVLYEAYGGNGMLCHPEAIFNELLADPNYQHLKHVWVLKDLKRFSTLVEEFSNRKNVSFVIYNSYEYYRELRTAKYLINNVTFPQQFSKRPGQIYVNTWHGVPLKKMGYDIPGKAIETRNMIRNFWAADYLLSAGPEMTNTMYLGAYKLKNVFNGKILELGNPRIDRHFSARANSEQAKELFQQYGLNLDERKIVLYCPTWRGANYSSPEDSASDLLKVVQSLQESLDSTQYRVLLKAHQVVADKVADKLGDSSMLVPNDIPTNLILGLTDLLITDYSSVFYDFLETKKPIVFYTPDLETYKTYRDVYKDITECPGYITQTQDELNSTVKTALSGSFIDPEISQKYEEASNNYCASDDGNASKRVIDVVFGGNTTLSGIRSDFSDGRKKILIYIGGMAPNGISTSALNLLQNIDYEQFDVTALIPYTRENKKIANIRLINENVRLIARDGTFNGGYFTNRKRNVELNRTLSRNGHLSKRTQRLWKDEWNRIFGDTEFDYLVDFSGYSPFWNCLLISSENGKRSVWLHNDLAADAERTVQGKKHLKSGLLGVFAMYKHFDRLVSVSDSLSEINKTNLQGYSSQEKFVGCRNSIHIDRIKSSATNVVSNQQLSTYNVNQKTQINLLPESTLAEVSATLAEKLPANELANELKRQLSLSEIFPSDGTEYTFISVGRLSPEKNHQRLIQAFNIVHEEHPHTRLVIVGSGPLEKDLAAEIRTLGLQKSVYLAGHRDNPFELMARANCFVLSSNYEGQPMVILEALTLKLPVITTRFGSAESALPPSEGLIVEQSVEALADGLRSFINGKVNTPDFSPEAYNEIVMSEFYSAIGADYPAKK
ncbi:CDP-glycerol glycerophosphotransferase family protein [Timonella sp. A28]|uniref:CDP-glycerol glycerophosphotransferase family protein n=1 Tax=Timonella sp. A28 TaxID=3442640 RepID=UPI003EB9A8FF